MLVRSSGETRSSASTSRIQSPWAASIATLRWIAKPRQGLSITCAPAARASSTVSSVEPPSTTITSSQKATLASAAGRRSCSFWTIRHAEMRARGIRREPYSLGSPNHRDMMQLADNP